MIWSFTSLRNVNFFLIFILHLISLFLMPRQNSESKKCSVSRNPSEQKFLIDNSPQISVVQDISESKSDVYQSER
jgi:hypothetical protein